MKTRWFVAAITAVMVLSAGAAVAGDEDSWFDLENCSFCKNLTAEKGLMDHMRWENHIIANGALSYTSVEPEYEEAFARARKNMEAVAAKLMSGEQLPMCNYCRSYGGLMMSGAKMEVVGIEHGTIELMTSDDPAVVEKIHAHARRTIDERKKMMAMEAEGHGHH